MILEGYKVVNPWGMSICPHVRKVSYAVGSRSHRPSGCGPLAVFKDLACAETCVIALELGTIFLCRYMQSKDKGLWSDGSTAPLVPIGTDYADWVELTQQVTNLG